jgi:hypothetical protein
MISLFLFSILQEEERTSLKRKLAGRREDQLEKTASSCKGYPSFQLQRIGALLSRRESAQGNRLMDSPMHAWAGGR